MTELKVYNAEDLEQESTDKTWIISGIISYCLGTELE